MKQLLPLLLLTLSYTAFSQKDIAISMAKTIMKNYPDSIVVMKYASHLEQDKLIPAGQTAEQAQKVAPPIGIMKLVWFLSVSKGFGK